MRNVERANERSGVDAGIPLCLHSWRLRPGATHRERSAALDPRNPTS